MKLTLEDINLEDIDWFYKSSTRGENDSINKIRENIIEHILTIPNDYKRDNIYGHKWLSIEKGIKNKIYECYNLETGRKHKKMAFTIEQKAGRIYRYDFLITFKDGTEIKVEFKYSTCMNDYPEFLSLPLNKYPLFTSESFIKNWYDNYLESYVNSLNINIEEIPPYTEYLNNLNDIKYRHPFFDRVHTAIRSLGRAKMTMEYNKIHHKAIEEYFNFKRQEENTLNLTELQIQMNTQDKYFLFCSEGIFNIEKIIDHMILTEDYIFTKNQIIITTTTGAQIKCLLRWKNGNGCSLPGWQISLKH